MDFLIPSSPTQPNTTQVNRKLRVGVPIERHAYSVYTRAMYERFYDELFESGSLTIKGMKAPNMYTILDTSSEDQQSMEFTVTVLDVDTAICDCGLFNHLGMLCKHAIKVSYSFQNFNSSTTSTND
jgi:hypothetical protein